jgi:hypothetical protein
MGWKIKHSRMWLKNLKGRDHLEDPRVGRRIILKQILKKQNERAWNDFICITIDTVVRIL